ncbi:MAG: hypothetical protein J0H18_04190 [Rhizobiales bacterium]|nr:hypothetical protein [Hyphomicrobiales bacterium]
MNNRNAAWNDTAVHSHLTVLQGGGGGNTFDPMEARVSALEAASKRIEEKLDKLIDKLGQIEVEIVRLDGRISTMDAKVEALPSAEAFGHLRGRVDSLPTISKVAGLLTIAVAAITILNNWQSLVSLFR